MRHQSFDFALLEREEGLFGVHSERSSAIRRQNQEGDSTTKVRTSANGTTTTTETTTNGHCGTTTTTTANDAATNAAACVLRGWPDGFDAGGDDDDNGDR